MNTDLVTLAGVSKHYGAQRAIDGLDLPREVLEHIYHRNAERLFGLGP